MKENYQPFEVSGYGCFCINCNAPISRADYYPCFNCGITNEEVSKIDWTKRNNMAETIKLNKIKSPKKLIPKGGNDCIMTPPQLAQDIVDYFSPAFLNGDKFLEPCKGEGAFISAIQKHPYLFDEGIGFIHWCELSEGIDFLAKDFSDKRYDWIITNPPFSKFRAFLKKSMEVADNVVFLCTINHIFGLKARLRDIKEAGLYIREALLCDTPESWPSSGFQVGAILLTKQKGDCKISHL